jgi:hypothetical protein
MRYGGNAGKLEQAAEPLGWSDIRRNTGAEKPPHERKKPQFSGREPACRRIASQAFQMASRHEVARAGRAGGFNQELPIRTNRLEAVMFDDDRLSRQQTEIQGRESGTGDVEDIAGADEPPKFKEARLADDAEWKFAVIVASRRSLCRQGDFEFARSGGITQFGKPASEREHDRLNATDARGEKVRIDQQLHVFRSPAFCRVSP